jgi:Acetyltransferase (GNAT) domain
MIACGAVSLATREEVGSLPRWREAFADERKDWRYYEIVNDTLMRDSFDFRYVLLRDDRGEIRAIQPAFIVDQDLVAGSGRFLQSLMKFVRRIWPRFLFMRTLMVGCAAGEGHLDGGNGAWMAEQLSEELPRIARHLDARLIVMKEFPSRYRASLDALRHHGFARVPSLPMTRLNIDYANFDEYVANRLSKVTRKNLRRKLRAADSAQPPIEMQVVADATPFVDEIYPLYLAVYERSKLHFEKLTREFLSELGKRMPDKVRFFIWRRGGKAVAFSLCMIHRDTMYDEYLGLDYSVAHDLHLYFYTLRDIITWAIERGLKWYVSSALNYEPKLHLRSDLAPLDLYVHHTSPTINAIMKRVLPLLEPTRNDPILRRFTNFSEVWR